MSYVHAEAAYQSQVAHIVFGAHSHPAQTLAGYAETVSQRLRLQTILGAITAAAVVNVLVQVVRRRGERVAQMVPAED